MVNKRAIAVVAAVYKSLVVKHPGHDDQSVHGHEGSGQVDKPVAGKGKAASMRAAIQQFEPQAAKDRKMNLVKNFVEDHFNVLHNKNQDTLTHNSDHINDLNREMHANLAKAGLITTDEKDRQFKVTLTPKGKEWLRGMKIPARYGSDFGGVKTRS